MTKGLTETQLHRLVGFNNAVGRAADPSVIMTLGEEAFQIEFGHKLFTILKVDREAGQMRRLYSSNTEINPIGGTKPIEPGVWAQRVLVDGLHYVGRNKSDLKKVFADHEALFGIGCESVLNTPVLSQGQVIGSINILDAANHYTADMCPLASLYGQCLAQVLF
ncbi:hypothetical protein ACVIIW_007247 [Bradyrhizobium sp. USDA 4449]